MIDKITKLIMDRFGKQEQEVVEFKEDLNQILNMPIFTLQRKCDDVFENVSTELILFFKKCNEKESIVRTYQHIYKSPYTFSELGKILHETNFELLDKGLLVNPIHIKKYDSNLLKIYFDVDIVMDFYLKKLPFVKKTVGSANDLANEKGLYAPLRRPATQR